jgi:hypothetical protein
MAEVFNIPALGNLLGLIFIDGTYKNPIPTSLRTNCVLYRDKPVDATVYCPSHTKQIHQVVKLRVL